MKKLLAAFAVFAFLGGCSTAPQDPPPRSIKAIDQSVVTTVKMNLKTDPELAVANLDVKAENNLLVLRGTVPSEEAKKRAEEIALKSAKIDKVANHIEISE